MLNVKEGKRQSATTEEEDRMEQLKAEIEQLNKEEELIEQRQRWLQQVANFQKIWWKICWKSMKIEPNLRKNWLKNDQKFQKNSAENWELFAESR